MNINRIFRKVVAVGTGVAMVGATIMGAMIRQKLIDKFYIFKAPKIYGGDDGYPMARGRGPEDMNDSIPIRDIKVRRFGDDILIRGYAHY